MPSFAQVGSWTGHNDRTCVQDEVLLLVQTLTRAAHRIRMISRPAKAAEMRQITASVFATLLEKQRQERAERRRARKIAAAKAAKQAQARADRLRRKQRLMSPLRRGGEGSRTNLLKATASGVRAANALMRTSSRTMVSQAPDSPSGMLRRRIVTQGSGKSLRSVGSSGAFSVASTASAQDAASADSSSSDEGMDVAGCCSWPQPDNAGRGWLQLDVEISAGELVTWTRSDVAVQTFLHHFTQARMALELDPSSLKPMVGLADGALLQGGPGFDKLEDRVAKRKSARRHLLRFKGFLAGLTDRTKFGMKELHKLMHEFSEHAGKDGQLSKHQFVEVMQTVFPMFADHSANGMVASAEGVDFHALFEAFDTDNSGKLDFRVRTV